MYQRLVNENESDDDDDHLEPSESIRLKSFANRTDLEDCIEHHIQPGETLQGIALRFDCNINKLRLYNRIMRDQDFFALKIIKIPILKYSCLTERANQKPTTFVNDLIDVNSSSNGKPQLISIGISNYLNRHENSDYKQFLDNLGKDLQEVRKLTEEQIENSKVTINQITNECQLNELDLVAARNAHVPSRSSQIRDEADSGAHLKYLLIAIVILCFLVPSYILYNLEHPYSNNDTVHHFHFHNPPDHPRQHPLTSTNNTDHHPVAANSTNIIDQLHRNGVLANANHQVIAGQPNLTNPPHLAGNDQPQQNYSTNSHI